MTAVIGAALAAATACTGSPHPHPSPAPTVVITALAQPLGTTPVGPDAMRVTAHIVGQRLAAAGVGARVTIAGKMLRVTLPVTEVSAAEPLIDEVGTLRLRQVLMSAPGSAGTSSPGATPAGTRPVPGSSSTDLTKVLSVFRSFDCTTGGGPAPTEGMDKPDDYVVACDNADTLKYLLAPAGVDGSQVAGADAVQDSTTAGWLVNIAFDHQGAADWFALTKRAYEADPSQNPSTCQSLRIRRGCNGVGIVLDGVVQSAPSSQVDGIPGGQIQITGTFTKQSAMNFAVLVKYGPLPLRLVIRDVAAH